MGAILFSRRRSAWPYIATTLLLLLLLLFGHHTETIPTTSIPWPSLSGSTTSTEIPPMGATHLKSPAMKSFWSATRQALDEFGPLARPIRGHGPPTDEETDPKIPGNRTLPNYITGYPRHEFSKLKRAHKKFANSLTYLAPKLPYHPGTRGIVMSGGGKYFGNALTSIMLMRKAGCSLPVQLFVDNHRDWDEHICGEVLPKLNTECVVMTDILGKDRVEKYQYKVLSILFSSFEELLFLDADAWPLRDPTPIFENEPFMSNGLIVWPDFWQPTVWPGFYDLIDQPVTNFTGIRSSESGMLMYSKVKHADSIILATYYNWYGPSHFYNVFSQGAPGEGDKETFRQAAIAVGKPCWSIRSPNKIMGRWFNETFETYGIKQMDPVEDFRLAEYKRNGGALDRDDKGEEVWAAPMFIHHNLWKMDLPSLPALDDPNLERNERGEQERLWGTDRDLIERTGFDVEEFMWRAIIESNCQGSFRKECAALRMYYRNVFKEEP